MIRRRSRGTIAMLDSSAGLTLLGVPLQQQWSCANSGAFAPTYYLHGDAPLYDYSFTDATCASGPRRIVHPVGSSTKDAASAGGNERTRS